MHKNALLLFFIWLVQSVLVLLLIYWNPNHFTTIDSGFYLESATHLTNNEGHSYVENGRLVWNGIFPIGYPACIALVSLCTGMAPLWASKVVNLLASAIFLYLLRRWFGDKQAIISGCVLLLGQFVKLWAHTWSEPLFVVVLFAWAYLFFKSPERYGLVFGLGVALMLVRYAGVFIIPFSLVMAALEFRKGRHYLAKIQFILSLAWAVFMAAYFGLNLYLSGDWYGGERFDAKISMVQNILLFMQGLLNEVLLFRDTDFTHPDVLFVVGLGLEIIVVVLLFAISGPRPLYPSSTTRFAFSTALGYLLFLFVIRLFSPFDAPGYRLLAPFSFLIFWGMLYRIKASNFAGKRIWIGGLALMASWLHLLPQNQAAAKLTPLMQWLGLP